MPTRQGRSVSAGSSPVVVVRRSAKKHIGEHAALGAVVVDVTSHGPAPWVRFSPFYPHRYIPVPLWPGREAASVEGIWQGLKRFEQEDEVDDASFDVTTMRGLKRTSRGRGRRGVPRGRVLGHQAGSDMTTLLGYTEARRRIYVPAYRWVLEHRLQQEVEELRTLAERGPVVLLDYTVNGSISDESAPLSHAALVKAYLDGRLLGE